MVQEDEWFDEGYGEVPKTLGTYQPFRFRVKANEDRPFAFVDDRPRRFWEHQFTFADGSFRNFAVCTQGMGPEYEPCAGCEHMAEVIRARGGRDKLTRNDPKRYYVGYLTVVDEIGDGQGNYTKQRQLFQCKGPTLDKLKMHMVKRGGVLIGVRYVTSRTGDKSVVVGDDWEKCDDVPRIPGLGRLVKWGRKFVSPIIEVWRENLKVPVKIPALPDDLREAADAALTEYYDVKDKDGKQVIIKPFDYKEIFPRLKRDEFRAWLASGGITVGGPVASAVRATNDLVDEEDVDY